MRGFRAAEPQATSLASPATEARGGGLANFVAADLRLVAVLALLAATAGAHAVALKSPLRLISDSTAYLAMAEAMVEGTPYDAPYPRYPPGYPALLAGLDLVGLGVSWAFVSLNLLFIAAGLLAAYGILRRAFGLDRAIAALACAVTLLSRDVIDIAAAPLSDGTFLGIAMASIFLLVISARQHGARAWSAIVVAALLAGAGLQIRTIGVALVPPVLFAIVSRPEVRQRLGQALRRKRILVLPLVSVFLAVLVIAGVAGNRGTGYFSRTTAGWDADASTVTRQARTELTALGALATNVTSVGGAPAIVRDIYPIPGALAIAVVGVGAWRRRRKIGAPDIFVFSGVLVLIAWPENASRLWMPLLPLLLGYAAVAAAVVRRRSLANVAICAFVAAYALGGAEALEDSTRLSRSGRDFPRVYASPPELRATYEVAFCLAGRNESGPILHTELRILRRYEPLASPKACAHARET